MTYIPRIGDVIKYHNRPMVVVDLKDYGGYNSFTYDIDYLFCELTYLEENQKLIPMSELAKHGTAVNIRGVDFPVFEQLDVAPFEITDVNCKQIRRKKAKTVTVWE